MKVLEQGARVQIMLAQFSKSWTVESNTMYKHLCVVKSSL